MYREKAISLNALIRSPDAGGTVLDRWKRQIPDEELLNLSPEELCKDRQSEEYFRLTTEGDCRDVVRYFRPVIVFVSGTKWCRRQQS
jgi:hypothetical protein